MPPSIKIRMSSIVARRKTTLDCLPAEVFFEILLQLPIKDIIKLRCVSRTWCSLISSPHFIAVHLKHSLSNPRHPPYFLLRLFSEQLMKPSLTLHSSDDPFSCNNFTELHNSHQNIDKLQIVAGSSNGLLCLAEDFSGYNSGSIVFWNPSIQKAITLPNPNFGIGSCDYISTSLGFGYVPKNNDYKLVRIVDRDCDFNWSYDIGPHWVQVYTFRTGTWRTSMVPGAPNHIKMRVSATFLHGALHWPARVLQRRCASRNVIVSFDLEDEVFREIGMPNGLQREEYERVDVAVVDGLLALVVRKNIKEWESVWVMKEYGVVESWTKLFDIEIRDISMIHREEVIGFGKNGELLLMTRGEALLSYKLSSRRTMNLHFHGRQESFFLDRYVESLVLLNVKDGVSVQQGDSLFG